MGAKQSRALSVVRQTRNRSVFVKTVEKHKITSIKEHYQSTHTGLLKAVNKPTRFYEYGSSMAVVLPRLI